MKLFQYFETRIGVFPNHWKIFIVALFAGFSAMAGDSFDELALNYHIMHPDRHPPGSPSDPNAAFCINGVYHLHYIFKCGSGFAFAHISSPDLVHWTWHKTTLHPGFTGHGMFSGTGFVTKEGAYAIIYMGEGAMANYIVTTRDPNLDSWNKPFPVVAKNPDGTPARAYPCDPDCFLDGNTYYAMFGGNTPLFKSQDLKTWTYLGPFFSRELSETRFDLDRSCPNFYRLGKHWMFSCISHDLGARYFIGDWVNEKFVPASFGRFNFYRQNTPIRSDISGWPDQNANLVFAPESVLTPDGRRVTWYALNVGHELGLCMGGDNAIMSLPRELDLPADGVLRVRPARELQTLRQEQKTFSDIVPQQGQARLADLPSDAVEIEAVIAPGTPDRPALRFGFLLFSENQKDGLNIRFEPAYNQIKVGEVLAPLDMSGWRDGQPVRVRIFVDKFLVEVFVDDKLAVVDTVGKIWKQHAFSFLSDAELARGMKPAILKTLNIWTLKSANQGFRDALQNRVWEPRLK